MTQPQGALLLVGGGNMGGAMAAGWLANGWPPARLRIVEPRPGPHLLALDLPAGHITPDMAGQPPADVVVLAVKPQIVDSLLPAVRSVIGADSLVVSICAGVRLARLQLGLAGHAAIVRAMPNTPASIRRAMTGAVAAPGVTPEHSMLAETLLRALGDVLWVDDERLMDPITAVSGSGPAFLFAFVEALEAAAVSVGLESSQARSLARSTVTGAAALLDASDTDATQLRRQVTSPNGTTQAGLDVLLSGNGLVALMRQTITAATRRSRELGESL